MSAQARPQDYARAIYDLALETWTRQLSDVQKALKQDAGLYASLRDAGLALPERLKLLDSATNGGLSADVRKLVGTLLDAGQIDQLEAILVELDHLARRRPELRLAQVTSAVPLTGAEQEALRARLSDKYGPNLDFQFDVDASLLGGVRLRVGDQVVDGSVAGKLAALRDRLTA